MLCINTAYAVEVGLVVEFPNNTYTECLTVEEASSGYDTLRSSSLDLTWSDKTVWGHALCKINGIGNKPTLSGCEWKDDVWNFYLLQDNRWTYMPVGFDAPGSCWYPHKAGTHYCAKEGDVIGLAYGKPPMLNKKEGALPKLFTFDEICKQRNDSSVFNMSRATITSLRENSTPNVKQDSPNIVEYATIVSPAADNNFIRYLTFGLVGFTVTIIGIIILVIAKQR